MIPAPAAAPTPDPLTGDTGPAWRRLRLLTFYRLTLAGLLMLLYLSLGELNPLDVDEHVLFRHVLLAWLVFALAAGTATRLQRPDFGVQAPLQVLTDIVALSLLIHASGGVVSPLSALLVVSVATGALLLPGRMAFLFAAVATLALLFETGISLLAPDIAHAGSVTRAGLMGLVLFATAGLAHMLAMRLRESESLATQRGIDLANLQQLNQHVIQQLHSGILVLDPRDRVRLANQRALKLIGQPDADGRRLDSLCPALAEQLARWRENPALCPESIPLAGDGDSTTPRFTRLAAAEGTGVLILLEDDSLLAQQSQQLKLASLGRMSASIAHEIRNPLGAISHAAQLLGESENLDPGDQRLGEIIQRHCQRVNEIIESVLRLSRRSPNQPVRLVLAEWLPQFRREFLDTERLEDERLALETPEQELAIEVDPGHLRQILFNLCQNAITHSTHGEPVRLLARTGTNNQVWIEVINVGGVIDPATATQIFEPFFTTRNEGTGLGLYMARELAELNRARLAYHRLEEGNCFRLEFPAAPPGRSAPADLIE